MTLCQDSCGLAENCQLIEGEVVSWPTNLASGTLGRDIQSVMARLPKFNQYLSDRKKQGEIYSKKVVEKEYEVGDLVSLPIPRVDRSNTCPKNLPCKIISINESGVLSLQCSIGFIEKGIHKDKVGHWLANDLHTENWSDSTVSLTKAYRSVTAYSSVNADTGSICKCKATNKRCATKARGCYKSGIGCGSKCHPSNPCSNPLNV